MENSNRPVYHNSETDQLVGTMGLTKREYFAGIALQTLCSDNKSWMNMMLDRRG